MTVLQNPSFTETFDLVLYAPLTLMMENFAADIRAQHMQYTCTVQQDFKEITQISIDKHMNIGAWPHVKSFLTHI